MNKRITLLVGPSESGKSYLQQKASREHDTFMVNGTSPKFPKYPLTEMPQDTKLILIDAVHPDTAMSWMEYFFNDQITIERQSKKPITIDTPEVILSCDIDPSEISLPASVRRRVMVISVQLI